MGYKINKFNLEKSEKLYLYALPLMVSEMVHRDFPNDQIKHDRVYPTNETAKFGRPNRDTLYSAGFVQLADSPYILEIPEVKDRYFLFPFFSAYGDVVDSLGTKSGKFGKYILLQDSSDIPDGYEEYEVLRFRESLIGYLMRVETKGEEDYQNVYDIQDKVILQPIHRDKVNKTDYKPNSVDPVVYAKSLSDKEFYELYGSLIKNNPALDDEAYEILEMLGYDRESGILVYDNIDEDKKSLLTAGRVLGEKTIKETQLSSSNIVYDGLWVSIIGGLGSYGDNHIARASILGTPGGWGANIPSECIYLDAETDSNKQPLLANKNYKVHFEKGKLPHAGAFWSLAVYGGDTGQVTAADNGIYSLNSNDYELGILKTAEDGSLDIYIGPDAPEDKYINNWIESVYPNDTRINLNIRVYIPDDITQEGKYVGPAILEI